MCPAFHLRSRSDSVSPLRLFLALPPIPATRCAQLAPREVSFRLYFPFRIGHQLAATRRTSRETTTKADAALPALRWVGPSYCKRANTNPNSPCLHQSFRSMAQISEECPDVYLPSSFITIPDYSTKFSPTDFFSSAATPLCLSPMMNMSSSAAPATRVYQYIGTSDDMFYAYNLCF